jgi:hypothetical protein
MAIPTLQSSATTTWATGTGINCTKPSGLAVGDLIVFLMSKQDGLAGGGLSLPSGFSYFTGGSAITVPGDYAIFAGYKIATSTEISASTLDFGFGGDTKRAMCHMLRISGHTPIASRYKLGSGTQSNSATPSISATVTPDGTDGSLLIQFWGAFGDVSGGIGTYAIATSNPTWTEGADTPDSTTRGTSFATASRTEVTATGNASCAGGSGTTDWGVYVISIPAGLAFSISETLTLTETHKQNISILTQETLILTESASADNSIRWNNQDKNTSNWVNQEK